MADYEAADGCDLHRAGVCYWHRVGDLLAAGYLEDTGKVRVYPYSGKERRVLRITAAGRAALVPFDTTGSFTVGNNLFNVCTI